MLLRLVSVWQIQLLRCILQCIFSILHEVEAIGNLKGVFFASPFTPEIPRSYSLALCHTMCVSVLLRTQRHACAKINWNAKKKTQHIDVFMATARWLWSAVATAFGCPHRESHAVLFENVIYKRESQSRQFIWCVFFVVLAIFIRRLTLFFPSDKMILFRRWCNFMCRRMVIWWWCDERSITTAVKDVCFGCMRAKRHLMLFNGWWTCIYRILVYAFNGFEYPRATWKKENWPNIFGRRFIVFFSSSGKLLNFTMWLCNFNYSHRDLSWCEANKIVLRLYYWMEILIVEYI